MSAYLSSEMGNAIVECGSTSSSMMPLWGSSVSSWMGLVSPVCVAMPFMLSITFWNFMYDT